MQTGDSYGERGFRAAGGKSVRQAPVSKACPQRAGRRHSTANQGGTAGNASRPCFMPGRGALIFFYIYADLLMGGWLYFEFSGVDFGPQYILGQAKMHHSAAL